MEDNISKSMFLISLFLILCIFIHMWHNTLEIKRDIKKFNNKIEKIEKRLDNKVESGITKYK